MNEISRCFGSYNKEKSFGIHMVHVVPCAGDKAKGKRQKAKRHKYPYAAHEYGKKIRPRGNTPVDHNTSSGEINTAILKKYDAASRIRHAYTQYRKMTYTLNNSSFRKAAREGIPMSLLR